MSLLANLFAGIFLANALPHLIAGLLGMPFPTPFAKPSGVGNSAPLVNFVWGSANLAVAALLLVWQPVVFGLNLPFGVAAHGAFLMGAVMSWQFGRVRTARR